MFSACGKCSVVALANCIPFKSKGTGKHQLGVEEESWKAKKGMWGKPRGSAMNTVDSRTVSSLLITHYDPWGHFQTICMPGLLAGQYLPPSRQHFMFRQDWEPLEWEADRHFYIHMDRGPQRVEGTRLCVKLNYKFVVWCACFVLM